MAIPRNLANLANQLNADGDVPKIEVNDSKVEVTDTGSNGTIVFNTDGSERMRVASNGRVGVGTISPNVRLDVVSGNTNTGGDTITDQTMSVTGADLGFNTNVGILNVATNNPANINVGGSIGFGGRWADTAQAGFGLIKGAKESATTSYSSYLAFYTRPQDSVMIERARFNSSGAFVLAGGATNANGIGIAFPATQVGSSDANTLDDYEEGTFTPVLNTGHTRTYDQQVGRYTKIGRVCTVNILLTGATRSGAASARTTISGLPFSPATVNVNNPLNVFSMLVNGFTVSNSIVVPSFWWDSGTSIELRPQSINGTVSTPQFDGDNIAASFNISIMGTYLTS
jgi:hypothetical protein